MVVIAIIGAVIDAARKPHQEAESPRIHIENRLDNIGNSTNTQTTGTASPTPKDEPRCNIEFLDVEVATNTNFVGQSIKTACAIFENEHVDGQKLRTPTLKGRLIFKHPDGHIVLDLSNVAWWPDEQLYALFSANSPRQLLLFFSPSPEAEECNLWARSVRPSPARIGAYKRRVREGESHAILEQIQTIEVQLLTETECLYRKILKFEDDASGFPKFAGVQN